MFLCEKMPPTCFWEGFFLLVVGTFHLKFVLKFLMCVSQVGLYTHPPLLAGAVGLYPPAFRRQNSSSAVLWHCHSGNAVASNSQLILELHLKHINIMEKLNFNLWNTRSYPNPQFPAGRSFGIYTDAKFDDASLQRIADDLIQSGPKTVYKGRELTYYSVFQHGADWLWFLDCAEKRSSSKGSSGRLKWISVDLAKRYAGMHNLLGSCIERQLKKMSPTGNYYVFEQYKCPEYIWLNL